MSNVLLVAIGNPRAISSRLQDGYRTVRYRYRNKEYETAYIMEALLAAEKIDRIILLGTAGSDWATLYQYLFYQDQNCLGCGDLDRYDDEYFAQLEALKNDPDVAEKDAAEVEQLLKPLIASFRDRLCQDIIVLKYGRDDGELEQNIETLYRIDSLLNDGDTLYLDLTHSFRSHQIFEVIAIDFFRNVSPKKLEIGRLTYGLLQGGSAQIVDLSPLMDSMSYMKAAEEFRRFGTVYSLTSKAAVGLSAQDFRTLTRLSEMTSVNNTDALQGLVKACHNQVAGSQTSTGGRFESRLLVQTIYQEIDEFFYRQGATSNEPTRLMLCLARWHSSKRKYLLSLTTMEEALITFVVDLQAAPEGNFAERKRASKQLTEGIVWEPGYGWPYWETIQNLQDLRQNLHYQAILAETEPVGLFRKLFMILRTMRNAMTHVDLAVSNPSGFIDSIEVIQAEIYKQYVEHFLGTNNAARQNREALKQAVWGGLDSPAEGG